MAYACCVADAFCASHAAMLVPFPVTDCAAQLCLGSYFERPGPSTSHKSEQTVAIYADSDVFIVFVFEVNGRRYKPV